MRDPINSPMDQAEVTAVMVHVPDPDAGLLWYERAFPLARRTRSETDDFEFLALGNVQIEIVRADEKVGSGPSGTVVYWRVRNFEDALEHLLGLGATLYRGPMRIERDQVICQVRDPWGNCIGLRGPRVDKS